MSLLQLFISILTFIIFYCVAWLLEDYWHIETTIDDVSIYFGRKKERKKENDNSRINRTDKNI